MRGGRTVTLGLNSGCDLFLKSLSAEVVFLDLGALVIVRVPLESQIWVEMFSDDWKGLLAGPRDLTTRCEVVEEEPGAQVSRG